MMVQPLVIELLTATLHESTVNLNNVDLLPVNKKLMLIPFTKGDPVMAAVNVQLARMLYTTAFTNRTVSHLKSL